MDNLACTVFITIYFFGDKFKKKIALYPRNKKQKERIEKKAPDNEKDIKKLIKSIFDILKIIKTLKIKKGLIIKEFSFKLKEGTGDAFNTAILYGLIWNLIGLIQTAVINHFIVKKKEITIEAEFKEKLLKLNLNCIFSIKVVNIILMSKELLGYYLKNRKGGDADVRPSDRRFNDYSNAKY